MQSRTWGHWKNLNVQKTRALSMFNPQVFYQTWNKTPGIFVVSAEKNHPTSSNHLNRRSLRKVLTKPCWSRNLAKWPQQTPVMAVVDGLFFPPPPGASIFHREMAVSKHRIFFWGVGTKKTWKSCMCFFWGLDTKLGENDMFFFFWGGVA